jgi:hypothetical protein
MEIQDLMLKFPHLPEKIFQKLDSKSLFKCKEVARSWQNIIDGKNYPWLRIVNIPTMLKEKHSYLHLAAKTGQIEVFQTALNQEEDKNIKNGVGETPFHLACANGCFRIVQLLLKTTFSIDINAKTNSGYTAFHYACLSGHSGVVKILLRSILKIASSSTRILTTSE